MRARPEAAQAMHRGLAQIRAEFEVPAGFPPEVTEAAERAVRASTSTATSTTTSTSTSTANGYVDRTDVPFATLDPAASTDLDQAFALERAGNDLVLRYAIADVASFVQPGDVIDAEAWRRGATVYLPDGRAGLYPPALSERAASLLPDGPRPAIVFVVRLDPGGNARLDHAEPAIIHSRAKLAYDSVTPAQLPPELDEFARRMALADAARGASRVEPPEQEVEPDESGGYRIAYRPRLPSEDMNAAMSLATNLAVARALFDAKVGLFRVMPEPDERAVQRLRHTANALGMSWAADVGLHQFERQLDARRAKDAAFMLAVRRAGGGAKYVPYEAGVIPWHAAMAATYAHATAPLRRLADRYVVAAALAVANGQPVAEHITSAFAVLGDVMGRADATGNRIERAVIDLAESVAMHGQEGTTFRAVVTDTDERGARIQLCDVAVVARVPSVNVEPGDQLIVKLVGADALRRTVSFERVA